MERAYAASGVTRVRRAFSTTRGRLTLLWLAIFAAALTVANIGIYLTVSFKANSAVEAELRSQADSVGDGVQLVDGRPTYRGDLPHETSSGLLVDLALVGTEGTIKQTRDQPLSDSILSELATPALRSGRPVLVDFYDQRHVHRRAYAAPVATISDQPVAVLASTPLTDVESSVALTTALVALLSLAVLAGSTALVHWLIGRVLSPVSRIANLAESLSERDLHRRVDVHAPDDEVGLWTFSTEQKGATVPYTEQVPIGPAAGNSARLKDVISGLHAEGGTALYATTRAAQQKLLASATPDRINAVVVLTDGKNEYPKDNDLDGLLRDLDANNLENSVRVFTIAYGDEADLNTLKRISSASRAAAYDARNPISIHDVLVNVISNF